MKLQRLLWETKNKRNLAKFEAKTTQCSHDYTEKFDKKFLLNSAVFKSTNNRNC